MNKQPLIFLTSQLDQCTTLIVCSVIMLNLDVGRISSTSFKWTTLSVHVVNKCFVISCFVFIFVSFFLNCDVFSPIITCTCIHAGAFIQYLMYTCQLFLRYGREIFILGVLGFLKMRRSFPKIPDEVRSLPKNSEVFRKRPKSQSQYKRELAPSAFHFKKSEIARKVLSFIHFTHDFRSLRGSEMT